MDVEQGSIAVKIARKTINIWVKQNKKLKPDKYPPEFDEKMGVFVTIHTYPKKDLRGCIGFPEPRLPLIDALVEAAIASTQDTRFPSLEEEELDKIIVEVSVLTRPELIKVNDPKDYPKKIRIGKDGLVVKKDMQSGLLLPQVATEHNLGDKDFLMHTCLKAGLPPGAWLEEGVEVFKFQSNVFSEKEPGNHV